GGMATALAPAVAAATSQPRALKATALPAVAIARDKHAMRRCLAAAGVPVPRFRLVRLADDPAALAGDVEYPCVLKPLALSASRGVIRANDPREFVAALRRVAALPASVEAALPDEARPALLVEGIIPGREVALEGLLIGGTLHVLALFDKPDPLDGPFFEETIYVTPSRLAEAMQAEIAAVTRDACSALGLTEGPIHAELRLNERGPFVLEIAARSIGGLCSRTLTFGTGLSLEELILCHALGRPLESLERERRAAGVMMIPIPRAGRLASVRGADEAAAVDGVQDVAITMHPGQEMVPLPEGWQYLGFIFARAETPDAGERARRRGHALPPFDLEEGAARQAGEADAAGPRSPRPDAPPGGRARRAADRAQPAHAPDDVGNRQRRGVPRHRRSRHDPIEGEDGLRLGGPRRRHAERGRKLLGGTRARSAEHAHRARAARQQHRRLRARLAPAGVSRGRAGRSTLAPPDDRRDQRSARVHRAAADPSRSRGRRAGRRVRPSGGLHLRGKEPRGAPGRPG